MADLPQILAGPILRRCTETMVTVWLATSIDIKDALELALYDASNVKAPKPIDVGTDHQVVKAGARLFIHLLVARPKATSGSKPLPFPRGTLLGYEVQVRNDSVPENSVLRRMPAWGTTETLDYGTYPWPTFFLQADRTPLRVLHGSCRRAYAPGRDAMAAPDTLIKDNLADLTKRPTLMILTGDQIYADDVLWAMWLHTSTVARKIAGYDETAPIDGTLRPLSKITGRKKLVLRSGLTTDDGENHLIGFSEYAAHYLLNWSETLWDGYEWIYSVAESIARGGLNEVHEFRETLPAVKRGLANIPTYMIFDDHDVTDDWNLDQQWQKETTASPLGTRLITCALYAYWLFQAWGNDPDSFDAQFVARIQTFCDLFAHKAGSPTAADTKDYDDFIRTSVGPATRFGKRPTWSYIVPSTPPIFVLDTRTSRDLQPRGTGPGLINQKGLQGLKYTIDRAKALGILNLPAMPLVMVSATPFWPVQSIELLQRYKIEGGGSPVEKDLELWRNNLRAHTDFLMEIMKRYNPDSIVFLSGDVHYGFTGRATLYSGSVDPQADVDKNRSTGVKYVDIYQLTSSAFKNENSDAALARHWYSNTGSTLGFSVSLYNDWVNYLFDNQGDVTMDLEPDLPEEFLLMNMTSGSGGPLLMPSYLFETTAPKVNHGPRWREEVHLYDHRSSGGLHITAEAHIGLVTFESQSLTHALYGLNSIKYRQGGLAPKIWGPAKVILRLGGWLNPARQ